MNAALMQRHEPDYKPQAWEAYTFAELGQWVHLLATRAGHRANPEKAAKDLYDARNYLEFMRAKLNAMEAELCNSPCAKSPSCSASPGEPSTTTSGDGG